MTDLLPCPFCGHDAVIYGSPNLTGTTYRIWCRECGVMTPFEAIAMWNRRQNYAPKIEEKKKEEGDTESKK